MKKFSHATFLLIVAAITINAQQTEFLKLIGPYLGQKPPGMVPEVFAPGIVSSEHQEHSSLAFSPDGKEMWWSRWRLPYDMDKYPQAIMFIRYENGVWGRPEVAPLSGKYRDGGPAFSADGKRIYFYSKRPFSDDSEISPDNNIWYVEKIRDGWSRPVKLGLLVNSPGEDATPSLAANGNLYFTSDRVKYDDPTGNMDIFVCEFHDGNFAEAKGLGPTINTPYARDCFPFIAPDERYIIFSRDSRRFDSEGHTIDGDRKLMISFRDKDGIWLEAVDMGPLFAATRFPSVSPDGKYLFFTKFTKGGHEDFYWVDARIIEDFKPKESRSDNQDILRAVQKGDIETVKALLAGNPDLSKIKDRWGRAPLNIAVDINNVKIIEYLIGSGADVEATDIYDWTPLFRAIDRGKKEATESLINKGADVNHGMEDGFKPVHLASSVGNTQLLELLLKKGADQDAKDRNGLTALHIAAAYGFNDAVEILISYKADLNAKSIDGGSPFHFAHAGGHHEIAGLIRSKGANAEPRKYPAFKGKYLGFKGPGLEPEIFLPGVLMHLNPPHNGLTISPDAKEIYWTETSIRYNLYSSIWFMEEVDGFWTPPRIAPFSNGYLDN